METGARLHSCLQRNAALRPTAAAVEDTAALLSNCVTTSQYPLTNLFSVFLKAQATINLKLPVIIYIFYKIKGLYESQVLACDCIDSYLVVHHVLEPFILSL